MGQNITNNLQITQFLNDRSEDFIDGFEAGKIYFFLKSKKTISDMSVLKGNRKLIEALCKHFGYTYQLTYPNGIIGRLTAYPSIICQN